MTRQLITWLTALVAVVWLVAATLRVLVIEDELTEAMDRSLQEAAERLVPVLAGERTAGEAGDARAIEQSPDVARGQYLLYQLRDAQGRVALHSDDAPSQPFEAPLVAGFWTGNEFQYFTAAGPDGSYLQVADLLSARDSALREAGNSLFLPLLALIPVLIATIALVVRRSLVPVRHLSAEIERKDTGNMEPVDPSPLPPELRQIAVSVNHLLARLRAALEAEREFTANSAHELRTPVAGALAQAQLLASQLPDGADRRRAQHIESSLSQLSRVAEKLLQLSRADAGLGLEQTEVDLVPVLDMIVSDLARAHPSRRLHLKTEEGRLAGPYSIDAFAIVVRNLVENALTHGDPDEPVDVRIEPGGVLRIVNGSPVLTPESLALMRQRFVRGRTTAPGSGLGLSIVDKLLSQMNAELTLASPASGRSDGFEAVIRFHPFSPGA